MGGCATKPKVLKNDNQKPPSTPPQKVDDKLIVPREGAEKEVVVPPAPADSPTKNLSSLSNLFDKESEKVTGVLPGTEYLNPSDTTFQANSQEAGTSKSMELLEKFPEPSTDTSTEKIPSQDSPIIPDNSTAALHKLPVVAAPPPEKVAVETHAENVAVETHAENIAVETDALTEKKSAGEVLDITPRPDIKTDAQTEKLAPQVSVVAPEEYTEALEKKPAAPAAVTISDEPVKILAVENTNAVEEKKPAVAPEAIENLKQTEEEVILALVHDQKLEENSVTAEEKKPLDTEDKKMLEEILVAVEKQIEVVELINATQESDSKEGKSDVQVEIK